ncbi:MAG: hypothetical protein ACKVIN_05965 [Longimicrobiales bacterium]
MSDGRRMIMEGSRGLDAQSFPGRLNRGDQSDANGDIHRAAAELQPVIRIT